MFDVGLEPPTEIQESFFADKNFLAKHIPTTMMTLLTDTVNDEIVAGLKFGGFVLFCQTLFAKNLV